MDRSHPNALYLNSKKAQETSERIRKTVNSHPLVEGFYITNKELLILAVGDRFVPNKDPSKEYTTSETVEMSIFDYAEYDYKDAIKRLNDAFLFLLANSKITFGENQ